MWSLVVFDSVDDPTQPNPNNVAWFLMGDFLRLSAWSGGLGAGCKNHFWWLGFYYCCRLEKVWNTVLSHLYFFMIIVKSLQLHGRRQIAESCKYCLVRMIVIFGMCFLYFSFLFLTGWEFRVNSQHIRVDERLHGEALFHIFSHNEIYSNTYKMNRIMVDFVKFLISSYSSIDILHHDYSYTTT